MSSCKSVGLIESYAQAQGLIHTVVSWHGPELNTPAINTMLTPPTIVTRGEAEGPKHSDEEKQCFGVSLYSHLAAFLKGSREPAAAKPPLVPLRVRSAASS
jgi:hypothetical protein